MENNFSLANQTSTLTLYYLPIRGIAEPIRNILNYLNIPFNQVNFDSQADSLRSRRGQQFYVGGGLPWIQHEGHWISDVVAICRYLCNRFQRPQLLGRTPQIQAQINQILIKYTVQKSKLISKIYKGIQLIAQNSQKQTQIQWSILKSIVTDESSYIYGCQKLYKKNKPFVLGQLTLIDFFFYEGCFYINNFFKTLIQYTPCDFLVNLRTYKDTFQQLQFYKANKQERQKRKIFLQVNCQKTKRVLKAVWTGIQSNLF